MGFNSAFKGLILAQIMLNVVYSCVTARFVTTVPFSAKR